MIAFSAQSNFSVFELSSLTTHFAPELISWLSLYAAVTENAMAYNLVVCRRF